MTSPVSSSVSSSSALSPFSKAVAASMSASAKVVRPIRIPTFDSRAVTTLVKVLSCPAVSTDLVVVGLASGTFTFCSTASLIASGEAEIGSQKQRVPSEVSMCTFLRPSCKAVCCRDTPAAGVAPVTSCRVEISSPASRLGLSEPTSRAAEPSPCSARNGAVAIISVDDADTSSRSP